MKIKPYTSAPLLAVLVYLLTLCSERLIAEIDVDANAFLVLLGLLQIMTYALPAVLYLLLFGKVSIKRMRLCAPTAVSIPLQVLLAVVLLLGSALISMVSIRLELSEPVQPMQLGVGTQNLLAVIIFAIIPAVCEEIVFRGIIMSSFEPCGVAPAIVGTSLLFAFAHMSLEDLPLYFFSSVVLCFVTYISRSLISSMLLHLLYNVFVITLGGYLNGIASHLESFSLLFIVMMFLICLLVVVCLAEGARVYRVYSERNLDSRYVFAGKSSAERIKARVAVYFSLPFLLAVLVFISVVVLRMNNIV